jgi:hypothetical protein
VLDSKRLLAMRAMVHYLVREANATGQPEAAALLNAAEAALGEALRREIRLVKPPSSSGSA